MTGPDPRLPRVGHENLAVESQSQSSPRYFDGPAEPAQFAAAEARNGPAQIEGDEQYSAALLPPMKVGQRPRLPQEILDNHHPRFAQKTKSPRRERLRRGHPLARGQSSGMASSMASIMSLSDSALALITSPHTAMRDRTSR